MLLARIAILIGIVGLLKATQATLGVSLVVFACLLAIVGRSHQAAQPRDRDHVTFSEWLS
jgi:hypothetical protein